MTQAIETCRYCGRQSGDEFSFGPDDMAPGVCPTCIDARMSALMLAAARRLKGLAGQGSTPAQVLRAWLRNEMVAFGITPTWAQRFIDADMAAFAAAGERLHR